MNKQLESFTKVKTGDYVVPIKDACEHKGKYSEAYSLGFNILDNAMKAPSETVGGIRNGDLAVITGISGSGKTTFSENIVMNLDKIAIPTLFFSYEVMIDNLYAKFVDMNISEKALIYTPKKNVSGNVKWIKEKIKEAQEKYYVKAIFIDHIDFLSPSDLKSSDQRRIIIRDICQELKTLAINLEIGIFLIAHVKKVQGREVEMQDLAESSALFQIPDYVFSVGRHYKTEMNKGVETLVPINEGIVKILKNRLTGEQPFMNFVLENNIIKDKDESGFEEKKQESSKRALFN